MEDLEIRRQAFHATLGVIIVALLYLGILDWLGDFIPIIIIPTSARPLLAILMIGAGLVLLSRRYKIPLINHLLQNFERSRDIKVFPGKGAFFAILGMFIVVTIFRRGDYPYIAEASILILAFGDSVSHIIGRKFGKIRHPLSKTKFLEGNISGAITGAIAASLILWFSDTASLYYSIIWSLIAASIAMFIEGIDFGTESCMWTDDNIIVPLISGLVLFILAYLM